ncbi:MAG: hypothetical protein JXB13_12045, partial [Phycisphaerae bacterium]|nr:hypothetical protein [Phycisphaerae bacterium]
PFGWSGLLAGAAGDWVGPWVDLGVQGVILWTRRPLETAFEGIVRALLPAWPVAKAASATPREAAIKAAAETTTEQHQAAPAMPIDGRDVASLPLQAHLASYTPPIQPVFLAALAQTADTNGLPGDAGTNGLGPWAQAQSQGQDADDAADSPRAGALGGESLGLLDGGAALMGYTENCCPDNKTNNAYHVVTADGVGATAILDGVTIKNGYADGTTPNHVGGGLLCHDSSPAIRHCVIECNAAGNGGGVSAWTGGAPTIAHCTIRYNWAISSAPTGSNGCGGMNIWLSDATVTDCTFHLNAGLGNRPGALVIGQCHPVITRCTFEENEAPNKGGAASMWGNAASPQFVGCTFSENRVLNSGAIGGAVVVENGCPATFRDCTFTGNEAVTHGGGVAVTGSTSQAKLVQCSFIGNDALSGGGLSVQSGQATAVNCRFLSNQGGVGGGAFVVGGTTAFANCVFSGNAVSGEMMALGGGLCVVSNGSADVTNCTFSRNTASAEEDAWGGGVYVESATATIRNTIAWGNLVNGFNTELGQIHKWSFSTFSLWFSCVQNWTSGGLGGAHNTANDPLLADPDGADNALGTADDDVRLTSGSSAIDTASDAAVPDDAFDVDRDGDADEPLPLDLARGNRFLGTGHTVDMGAYEYLNPGDDLGDPEPPPAGAPAPAPSGTAYIAFAYDALGRRIERTVDSGGASVEVTRYYYDGQNVVVETDADEAPHRSFMHGSQYIDERVLTRLPTGQEYYYLPRELYSVAALTDETGTIVEAATYDTYGQVAVYDGSAQAVEESPIGNPYYFTGRRLDLLPTASSLQPVAKQLYHYRARAYKPRNGRFLQRDPDQYSSGCNLYEYVRSTPLDLRDPLGLRIYCKECLTEYLSEYGIETGASQDRDEWFVHTLNDIAEWGVEQEILYKMLTGPHDWRFDTKLDIKRDVDFRLEIVKAAREAQFQLAGPDESKCNPKYFYEGDTLMVKDGVDAAEAIEDAWKHPETWASACQRTTWFVVARAYLNLVGRDAYNEEVRKRHAKGPRSLEFGQKLSYERTASGNDDWLPGDYGYIDNTSSTAGGLIAGENVIYLGQPSAKSDAYTEGKMWGIGGSGSKYLTVREWVQKVDDWSSDGKAVIESWRRLGVVGYPRRNPTQK